MATSRALLRCVAMLILLLAGADFVANDLFGAAPCEDTTPTQQNSSGSVSDDDCFCCCGHIVVMQIPQFTTFLAVSPADAVPVVTMPASPDRGAVYRPPRA